MRWIPLSSWCLTAALVCTSPACATTYTDGVPAPTDLPDVLEAGQHFDVRQATGIAVGATQGVQQVPPMTVVYMPSSLGSSVTWLPYSYTQTFAPVPDQWPSAGAGEIGLGTLTKEKRDIEATPAPETGIAGRIRG